jgi:hypothetical protein
MENVDEIRDDVVKQSLIVSNDDHRAVLTAQRVDVGDDAQRIDIETRSVSSRMASFGSNTAICKISLRFFSPPEKPSLSAG